MRLDDLVDRAVRHALASPEHQQLGAQLFDEVEQVRAEDHRGALRRALSHRLAHPAHAGRIESGERLVEYEDRRVVQQSARDGELLPHAARQLSRQRSALVAELELVEQRPDARLDVGHAVQPRDEAQVLLDR